MVKKHQFLEPQEQPDGHLMTVLIDDTYLHHIELLIKVQLHKADLVNLYPSEQAKIILQCQTVMIGILELEIIQLIIG